MTTEAQITTNRLNAQKSTGPRTAEGKAAVAQNAVKHGLRAQAVVLPGEEPDQYGRYHQEMLDQLHPEGLPETDLAERIVGLTWRLRRAGRYHDAVFAALYEQQAAEAAAESAPPEAAAGELYAPDRVLGRMLLADFSGPRVLERVQVYERRIESSLSRAWSDWRKLRDQPRPSAGRGILSFAGTGDTPATRTPDGVTTNRPADTPCPTKPMGPQASEGNGGGGTNKPHRHGPTVGKETTVNKQSQSAGPAFGGLRGRWYKQSQFPGSHRRSGRSIQPPAPAAPLYRMTGCGRNTRAVRPPFSQGQAPRTNAKSRIRMHERRESGGIAKALGLDDGPTHGKSAIAKLRGLRLTMPPRRSCDFAFAVDRPQLPVDARTALW